MCESGFEFEYLLGYSMQYLLVCEFEYLLVSELGYLSECLWELVFQSLFEFELVWEC